MVVNSQNRPQSPFIEESSGVEGKTWSHSGILLTAPKLGLRSLMNDVVDLLAIVGNP